MFAHLLVTSTCIFSWTLFGIIGEPPKIKNLASIVDRHLNGAQLISYTSKYLTKPDDNYESVMLAISAIVRQVDGTIEELPLVAKLPPVANDIFWNMFNPEVTSLKENAIYENVSQSLQKLQLDQGIPKSELIDLFAKSYGCRISLNENASTLDRDAVLVLENLQNSGYRAGERQIMFDYDRIMVVLKYVAKFHALPVALRSLQPVKFNEVIRARFTRYDIHKNMDNKLKDLFKTQMMDDVRIAIGDDIKAIQRIDELEMLYKVFMGQTEECKDSLFSTIAHNDLWINNVMILYDETGAPSKVKVKDFQISQYESLMHDLIFLLLSSVEYKVLDEHFESLLQYYYAEFLECLEKLSVNTKEYSYDRFKEEVHRIAPIQIVHAIYMSRVLLADDEKIPTDYKDCDTETFKSPPSAILIQRYRDIIKVSQKYGLFW